MQCSDTSYNSQWWYLEQVLPSTWGVKKHPLFCFGCGKKQLDDEHMDNEDDDSRVPEDVKQEAMRVQRQDATNRSAIQVINLRKVTICTFSCCFFFFVFLTILTKGLSWN